MYCICVHTDCMWLYGTKCGEVKMFVSAGVIKILRTYEQNYTVKERVTNCTVRKNGIILIIFLSFSSCRMHRQKMIPILRTVQFVNIYFPAASSSATISKYF